jgi:monofunctional biosynthetic peptidoglycan transglycosylase
MLAPMPRKDAPRAPRAARVASPAAAPGRWGRILAGAAEALAALAALGALLLWLSVPDTGKLAAENPTSTAFIDLRRDQAEEASRPFKLEWDWRPLGKISRYLRAAVVYAEDYNFYRHDGVDWGAIENAVESNLDKGSLAIGGSTITQQLAKNLYLSPRRSILRKARELLIAFSLEDHLSKQRILELYLNVVEWGDGVFGAEAAARHWFGHSAQSLSPAEAARLAIALPNPIQRAPNVKSPALTRSAVRIIRLLRMQGLIDAAQERAALDEVGAPEEKVLPSRKQGQPPSAPGAEPQPTPGPEAQPTPGTVPPAAPGAATPPGRRGAPPGRGAAPPAQPESDPPAPPAPE